MMEKTLVVMAAGMGSRFGGLKQITPVGPSGEFILDYSVYDALRAGFTKVVFVIKKELEDVFRETIGKRIESKIKVEYAFQDISDIPDKLYLADKRVKPWGTVQAVLCAKEKVPQDFVVINADDFYGRNTYEEAYQFLDTNYDESTYASITFPYIKTASLYGSVKRAVCFTDGDNITNLVESEITTEERYAMAVPLNGKEPFKIDLKEAVSMNVFAFKHSIFDYLEEYFKDFFKQSDDVILNSEALLPELVKAKITSGEIVLKNVPTTSTWFGVTYKEDLDGVKKMVEELIEKGEYPKNLWA